MFSSPYTLERRTGSNGINRFEYLKQLINEYETTTKDEYKEQILANLANFSYDPINYEYFRRLNVIDIFLKIINMPNINEKQLGFAIGAICNLCLDQKNKDYLFKTTFSKRIIEIFTLSQSNLNESICLNIMTILIFMDCSIIRQEIKENQTFLNQINLLSQSSNKRLSNLATLLLEEIINI